MLPGMTDEEWSKGVAELRRKVARLERIERAAEYLAAYPPDDRKHHSKAYVLWDDLDRLRAALRSD